MKRYRTTPNRMCIHKKNLAANTLFLWIYLLISLLLEGEHGHAQYTYVAPEPQPFDESMVRREVPPPRSKVLDLDFPEITFSALAGHAYRVLDVEVPREFTDATWDVAISAEVRAKERKGWLTISADNRSMESALYTGSGTWEVLTVVAAKPLSSAKVSLTLNVENSISSFKNFKLLLYKDDRFKNVVDQTATRWFVKFKENVFRKKTRYRVGVIGNSTVAGQQPEPHHSLPYLLQLKLETYYPGTFEVMNLGRNASTLLSQTVQFFLDCNLQHFLYPGGRQRSFQDFTQLVDFCQRLNKQAPVSAWPRLDIDLYLLGSMWNDASELSGGSRPSLYYNPEGKPYHETYVEALFTYLARGESEPLQTASHPDVRNLRQVQKSDNAEREAYARSVYEFLLKKFISFARERSSEVALFTLPEITGDREDIKRVYGLNHPDIAYVSTLERIQNEGSAAVAQRESVPIVDITKRYHRLVREWKLSPKELDRIGYFLATIGGDIIHLSARGNAAASDAIFNEMRSLFEKIYEE